MLTTLFFGGWSLPFLEADGLHFFGAALHLNHLTVTLIQIGTFLIKTSLLCWFTMMIRWSLPRFRYDQVMKLCWRYMLPLSLLNIFVTGIAVLLFNM